MKKKYFVLKVNKKGTFDLIADKISFEELKLNYPRAKRL